MYKTHKDSLLQAFEFNLPIESFRLHAHASQKLVRNEYFTRQRLHDSQKYISQIFVVINISTVNIAMILVVREAEVILPTFSRDKSILLLNCPLHA